MNSGHETVTLQTTLLSKLPSQITSLQASISSLRSLSQPVTHLSSSPNLTLPLPATLSLLATRRAELAELDQQHKTLQQALPRKTREMEEAEDELRRVEAQKERMAMGANEAIKRREGGSGHDQLEGRGRWLKGVEGGLRGMLRVEG